MCGLALLLFSCNGGKGKLRAPVKLNGKYGYIDENDNMVIDAVYDEAWSFIRGSAIVKKENKWGMIDKYGDELTKMEFDSIIPFSEHCCIYLIDSLFGFLEQGTGKRITEPAYDHVFYYTVELCAVQKGHSLGLVNNFGKIVCPPVVQDIREMIGPGAIIVEQDTTDEVTMLLSLIQGGGSSRLGLINRKGEIIMKPAYDEIFDDLANGFYYPFMRDPDVKADTLEPGSPQLMIGLYGIADTTGKLLADVQFEEMPVYGDGLFRVMKNKKYGFADAKGKMVIPAEWDYAVAFSEGKAIVVKGNQASIINKQGKILAGNLGSGAGLYRFNAGLARCRAEDGRYGFLDETGKRVIPVQFDAADDFDPEDKVAIVSKNDQYGLINTSGEFVVNPEYEFIFNLGDGYYQVKHEDGGTGVVDKTGKKILNTDYDEVFLLQKNLFTVEKDMLTGCYDASGKEIFPPVSITNIFFLNGRSEVSKDGKFGMIDTTGKFIIPAQYDSIGYHYKGYTIVMNNNKFGAVDSLGHTVIPEKFQELRPFLNGYAVFRENDKFGFVNLKGEVVIPAKYEDAGVLVDPDRQHY
ncbi:MAG: hypothetical protein Fur0041_08050 [Bacteroidia bacterium]